MNMMPDTSTNTNDPSAVPSAGTAREHPVRALSRPEPPPGLHNRIVAAINAEAARERQRRRLRRCIGLAIAVLPWLIVVAHTDMR